MWPARRSGPGVDYGQFRVIDHDIEALGRIRRTHGDNSPPGGEAGRDEVADDEQPLVGAEQRGSTLAGRLPGQGHQPYMLPLVGVSSPDGEELSEDGGDGSLRGCAHCGSRR